MDIARDILYLVMMTVLFVVLTGAIISLKAEAERVGCYYDTPAKTCENKSILELFFK